MDSYIKTGSASALLAVVLGAALMTPVQAGVSKGEFLVTVTVVDSCHAGQARDTGLSQYTGFSLHCPRGTDYTLEVSNAGQRSLSTDASGVTSVTVRF